MAHGDTRIIPLELQETSCRSGSRSSRCARIPAAPANSAAGSGFRKSYRMLAPCMVQTNLDRTKFPPWGVQGGKEAKPGRFTLVEAATGTQRRRSARRKGSQLAAGDLVCVETGGGGGYGPPGERALAAIQRDLDAGYVSPQAAEHDYGVTIGADGRARRVAARTPAGSGRLSHAMPTLYPARGRRRFKMRDLIDLRTRSAYQQQCLGETTGGQP